MQAAARDILSQAIPPLQPISFEVTAPQEILFALAQEILSLNQRHVPAGSCHPGWAMCLGLTEDYVKGPTVFSATRAHADFTQMLNAWVLRQ